MLQMVLTECCFTVIISILELQDTEHSCLGLAFEAGKVEKLGVHTVGGLDARWKVNDLQNLHNEDGEKHRC